MTKMSEFYSRVKAAVLDETGIAEEELFASNVERAVDARYILVHCLCKYLADGEVCRLTGLSRAGVNKMRNNFGSKLGKFSVRISVNVVEEKAKEAASIAIRTCRGGGGGKYLNYRIVQIISKSIAMLPRMVESIHILVPTFGMRPILAAT